MIINIKNQKNLHYNPQWATYLPFFSHPNTLKTSICTYLQILMQLSSESLSSLTLLGFFCKIIHFDLIKLTIIHFIWMSQMQFLSICKPLRTAFSQLRSFCIFFPPNKSPRTHGSSWTLLEQLPVGQPFFLTSLHTTKARFSKSFIW